MTTIRLHRVKAETFYRMILNPRRRTCYVQRGLMSLLTAAKPAAVPWDQIMECIYGGFADGGPMNPHRCIYMAVIDLRRRGVPIINHFNFGYRLAA